MFNKSNVIMSSILAIFILFLILTTTSFAAVNGGSDNNSSCCQGFTGNTDCSESEDPDITDITRVIDFLYLSHTLLCCPEEADTDGSGGDPDITDITRIIDYLYLSHNPLADCPSSTVTDIDGNVYQTVTIGTQVWMAENLKVTHYHNGDAIPNVTDGGDWEYLSTGAYCDYANDPANVATYGRLYNWYAVDDSRNIAPEGWHVPSDNELKQLEMYLGLSQAEADNGGWRGTDEGGKLKEAGTTHWNPWNDGATNESGFSALPGGCRYHGGSFNSMGDYALFWSSTEGSSGSAWYRSLITFHALVGRDDGDKQGGISVRCVKD